MEVDKIHFGINHGEECVFIENNQIQSIDFDLFLSRKIQNSKPLDATVSIPNNIYENLDKKQVIIDKLVEYFPDNTRMSIISDAESFASILIKEKFPDGEYLFVDIDYLSFCYHSFQIKDHKFHHRLSNKIHIQAKNNEFLLISNLHNSEINKIRKYVDDNYRYMQDENFTDIRIDENIDILNGEIVRYAEIFKGYLLNIVQNYLEERKKIIFCGRNFAIRLLKEIIGHDEILLHDEPEKVLVKGIGYWEKKYYPEFISGKIQLLQYLPMETKFPLPKFRAFYLDNYIFNWNVSLLKGCEIINFEINNEKFSYPLETRKIDKLPIVSMGDLIGFRICKLGFSIDGCNNLIITVYMNEARIFSQIIQKMYIHEN